MTTKDSIEVTGATIDEAINQALTELGAAEDDVVIEVLSTPRSGVLGLGSRQARVRVSRRPGEGARSEAQSPPPAPARPVAAAPRTASVEADAAQRPVHGRTERAAEPAAAENSGDSERRSHALDEQASEAARILSQVLELMGEKAEVRVTSKDPEAIELEIKGDGSGILIGRHGQTLDALEYLLNRLVARQIKDAVPLVLDTESYRARRRSQLERMALSMGERAKREHSKMMLEPMAPRDRRIIHLTLGDDPLLTTRSTGDGYMRAIEIVPVEGKQERSPRSRQRESEAPIGQQGGFKRGQKRIV
jgi:spoIIIJ-associated protein